MRVSLVVLIPRHLFDGQQAEMLRKPYSYSFHFGQARFPGVHFLLIVTAIFELFFPPVGTRHGPALPCSCIFMMSICDRDRGRRNEDVVQIKASTTFASSYSWATYGVTRWTCQMSKYNTMTVHSNGSTASLPQEQDYSTVLLSRLGSD